MPLFQNHTRTSPGPLVEYTVGRFKFSVPKEFTSEAFRFSVTPFQQHSKGRSSTSKIEINEHPWQTSNHGAEFDSLWKPLQKWNRKRLAEVYAKNHDDGGRPYAENLDASIFFGHKSVSVSYDYDGYPYPIESFIALPQGVLQLKEKRGAGTPLTPMGTNIEAPAAELFKHYTWGKKRPSQQDTFYTALGMIVGYPTEKEDAILNLRSEAHKINVIIALKFNALRRSDSDLDRLPSEKEALTKIRALGIDFHQLSRGPRMVAGRELLEIITKGREHSRNPYTVEFLARSLPGETATANAPAVTIRLLCSWDQRVQAVEIWNTVLASFGPVWGAGK